MFKRKLKRECWNVDYSLILWLNEHLIQYKKDASKMIDLSFHKFQYGKSKNVELVEMIDKLIYITTYLKEEYYNLENCEQIEKYVKEMYEILSKIHFYLWW